MVATAAPASARLLERPALSRAGVSVCQAKAHADRAPLKRNVEVSEVGDTALFLASDMGSGITGEIVYVDCGYNIMGF